MRSTPRCSRHVGHVLEDREPTFSRPRLLLTSHVRAHLHQDNTLTHRLLRAPWLCKRCEKRSGYMLLRLRYMVSSSRHRGGLPRMRSGANVPTHPTPHGPEGSCKCHPGTLTGGESRIYQSPREAPRIKVDPKARKETCCSARCTVKGSRKTARAHQS